MFLDEFVDGLALRQVKKPEQIVGDLARFNGQILVSHQVNLVRVSLLQPERRFHVGLEVFANGGRIRALVLLAPIHRRPRVHDPAGIPNQHNHLVIKEAVFTVKSRFNGQTVLTLTLLHVQTREEISLRPAAV